ncbi:4Fe-4S binding protein [Jannaschia aquimarina]|uniref:YccM protein n=1 Tax=Jannaschia aquimarina TaxID=935700 RepID=A0A0D1D3R2_9RHOB|nr:4Fe-4S binding protein [Jannaschia aquimarina]KIT14738.1 putative electron transport protein YccM [Jannaschia aquimarina]SNS76583.1 Regulator of nitric oxide reductase transcription [Jannaschia aquimarina]
MGGLRAILSAVAVLCSALAALAEPSPRERLAPLIVPPMELGALLNDDGVYELLNSGGAHAGYVFETEPMAPLPGFSGASINMLVTLDLDGRFLDVKLLDHNEPIFVSGLPERLFYDFFDQYRGHSISDSIVVGSPYGGATEGSSLVYLDGVTKGTASVRIAHESVLAAALQVAREKMGGISTGPPAYPDPNVEEDLSWADLVEQGIVTRHTVTNAEIQADFEGTIWARDDPEALADPDGIYMDLWVVDLGPPSIARAVLSERGMRALENFQAISTTDEPVLVVETARHGLVSEEFVRNTAPDWISAEQGGFPVAFRDSDLLIDFADDVPDEIVDAVDFGAGLILRTDRRLGFDPSAEWVLKVAAVREHGMFQPEIGRVEVEVPHVTPARFFARPEVPRPIPPWLEALRGRAGDLVVLSVGLIALLAVLGPGMNRLAGHRHYTAIRLGILAAVIGFVGWWGQGQLSIVTPLATLRAAIEGGSYNFLIYDPFSLVIWAVAIAGFVAWGRGLFCGWLCPFGAMQEFAAHLGRLLRLPQIEPSATWDARLKWLKYVVLAGLVGIAVVAPARLDQAVEVEPFKTAVTTFFVREWYFVAYAVGLLLLSMVLFKGFCRYLCPLGALMAIGGLVRGRDWIARREACGSPCQLCKVKCRYGAIEKSGKIDYSECFQCLDCVTIHDDPKQCVPLVLAAKGRTMRPRPEKIAAE